MWIRFGFDKLQFGYMTEGLVNSNHIICIRHLITVLEDDTEINQSHIIYEIVAKTVNEDVVLYSIDEYKNSAQLISAPHQFQVVDLRLTKALTESQDWNDIGSMNFIKCYRNER